MTLDDLKQRRDGHLAFGPIVKQRIQFRAVFEPLGYERDRRTGHIIGVLTTDGGRGAISWGLKADRMRELTEAEYQGA